MTVSYDLMIPADLGRPFARVFEDARRGGYRGLNITYPYKEQVLGMVTPADARIARIGAVNTVIFDADGPRGHNTDYSGFIAAFRAGFGDRPPGRCLLVGAGGVGRAVAFALGALGAAALIIRDQDASKSTGLARDVSTAFPEMSVECEGAEIGNVNGLMNCTPIGMAGRPGLPPVPDPAFAQADWAFDAVYTPVETRFLTRARAQGLTTLSGWELFFFQGLQAWELFSGLPADAQSLRAALSQESQSAGFPPLCKGG